MAEAKAIKEEIATLKQRGEFQYEESVRTLKTAYQQQIAVTSPKLPPPLSEKDQFESTSAFNARREEYDTKVKLANEGNVGQIDKLKGEENLKLAQAKLDYLEQQIKVLRPFIERLKALQARVFVLPGEPVSVELGPPDADRNCFPTTITHKSEHWTVDWKYSNTNKARDIYKTRNFLKAEAMVQLADTTQEGYVMTEARITHPGTGEQQRLVVAQPIEFSDISVFDLTSNKNKVEANNEVLRINYYNDQVKCLQRKGVDKHGLRVCGDVVLDESSGLIWARNGDIAERSMKLDSAKPWINKLTYGGYSDWRLPSKDELQYWIKKIEAYSKQPNNRLVNIRKTYMSSSTKDWNYEKNGCVYTVDINGNVSSPHKSWPQFVWPVRAVNTFR